MVRLNGSSGGESNNSQTIVLELLCELSSRPAVEVNFDGVTSRVSRLAKRKNFAKNLGDIALYSHNKRTCNRWLLPG